MKIELLTHPKWLRLEHHLRHVPRAHLLGHFELLLHSTYAQAHPDFRSADDLEFAAGWVGESGELAAALERWGFVDRVGDILRVHDWLEHAPRTVQRRRSVREWAERVGVPIPLSASRGGADGHGHGASDAEESGRPADGKRTSSGRQADVQRTASGRPLAPYPDPDPDPDPDPMRRTCPRLERGDGPAPDLEVIDTLPLKNGGVWKLTSPEVHRWAADLRIPADLVKSELRKARLWLDTNPRRRKTAAGMKRFCTGWLTRALEGGGLSEAAEHARERAELEALFEVNP